MSIGSFFKTCAAGAQAHKPEIIIGGGIITGVGALVMAVKETPKCIDTFDEELAKQPIVSEENENGEMIEVITPLSWKQKIIILAKCYWGAIILEGASIFLIIWGTKIRIDSYTALMAVYSITKAEKDDLKKIIDSHTDGWKKKFEEKAAEVHMSETNPEDVPPARMSNTEVPMPLPLFYDDQAKVYFRISEEDLRDAVSEITHRIDSDPFQAVTMNDWMDILNVEDVNSGDYYLFTTYNYSEPLKYKQIGVKESPTGEPARVMKFNLDYILDTRGYYCEN